VRRRAGAPSQSLQATAKQLALDFEADTRVLAEEHYERGCELEAREPARACEAYRRALALWPEHPAAHINLGRLLHEAGAADEALGHYRRVLAAQPDDPVAAFNLGVALEDLGRRQEAVEAYQRAIELDPAAADAHFNLSRLLERLDDRMGAFRHLKAYRNLTRT
jgi:tetratricopeptide (TPR) repeat protein